MREQVEAVEEEREEQGWMSEAAAEEVLEEQSLLLAAEAEEVVAPEELDLKMKVEEAEEQEVAPMCSLFLMLGEEVEAFRLSD